MGRIRYTKRYSKQFYVARKPRKIAELLVKACNENDDRVGQALYNALWLYYKKHEPIDTFYIEDDEMVKILESYLKGNAKRDGPDKD